MRRTMSKRPPFENRWTSGKVGWRWYQELEALGADDVRLRIALQDAPVAVAFPYPEIPAGFVRDWLRYRAATERRERAQALGMGTLATAITAAAAAALGAAVVLAAL